MCIVYDKHYKHTYYNMHTLRQIKFYPSIKFYIFSRFCLIILKCDVYIVYCIIF